MDSKVHEAALAKGVKVSGATVHYVDEGMDTGEIIFRRQLMYLMVILLKLFREELWSRLNGSFFLRQLTRLPMNMLINDY